MPELKRATKVPTAIDNSSAPLPEKATNVTKAAKTKAAKAVEKTPKGKGKVGMGRVAG